MKYFTPERFVRLQDLSDEVAARAVMTDWDHAVEAYAVHLKRLQARSPKELGPFIELGSLHDARLVAMWQERQDVLRMLVQREREPSHIVDLNYRLVKPPRINQAAFPEAFRSVNAAWLYDELNVEPRTSFDPASRQIFRTTGKAARSKTTLPVFRHDILLSNGWEVGLRFYRLSIHRYPALQAAVSRPA